MYELFDRKGLIYHLSDLDGLPENKNVSESAFHY